jgi:two-component system nitrate/nitrite response regulator NarL
VLAKVQEGGNEPGRVLVVDDDRLYAEVLAKLITQLAGHIVAIPSAVDGVTEAVSGTGADACVVRVRENSDGRLQEAVRLLGGELGTKVVLVATDPGRIGRDLSGLAGVAGAVPTAIRGVELVKAIERARQGEELFGMGMNHGGPYQWSPGRPGVLATLTPRETEVLELLAAGGSASRAAEVLGISSQTVRTHLQGVMAKLAVHSQTEMVWVARQIGLHPDRARLGLR